MRVPSHVPTVTAGTGCVKLVVSLSACARTLAGDARKSTASVRAANNRRTAFF
jgi:hypothetical protein